MIFGWIPFSIGDILYTIGVVWILKKGYKFSKAVINKKISVAAVKIFFYKISVQLLFIYCLFNFLWGINYDRKGIADQLGLGSTKYSVNELRNIDSLLLIKVNECKYAIVQKPPIVISSKDIFNGSVDAYKEVNKEHSFIQYNFRSVKSSLWGWLGNYIGFTGYYNPFTGEAQVNTTVPIFLQPYTTCHEIAHQLGYAKENEANFVGYLAASSSKDSLFKYSVYLDLFIYANRSLARVDSISAKNFAKQILPAVKTDLAEWKKFAMDHQNPIEPRVRWMYGKFLENNAQPKGILSYDEVTALLIAYYKKYGSI